MPTIKIDIDTHLLETCTFLEQLFDAIKQEGIPRNQQIIKPTFADTIELGKLFFAFHKLRHGVVNKSHNFDKIKNDILTNINSLNDDQETKMSSDKYTNCVSLLTIFVRKLISHGDTRI
jgi:hypothetical protein